jgi:hypothetical protein
MPAPIITQGMLITRQWSPAQGLVEQPQAFASLDELYVLCLRASQNPSLVERFTITGTDENGHVRTIAFTFQSITVSPVKP